MTISLIAIASVMVLSCAFGYVLRGMLTRAENAILSGFMAALRQIMTGGRIERMQKLFYETHCYHCGKLIIVPDRAKWLYKKCVYTEKPRTKYFCSYSCKQQWEQSNK